MSLVSVIIPTYNSASSICDTIDCVVQQTHPDIELIIVDDCSTDDTVSVVRRKLESDFKSEWRIVELETNGGPSAARNVGLGLSKGEWVQFLDSDDFLAPSKLALQVAHCERAGPDVSFVYGSWCLFHSNGGKIIRAGKVIEPDMAGKAPIMCMVGGNRPLHAAGLARRSALEEVGGFDKELRFWECEELTLRLARIGRLERTPSSEPLYLWRMQPGQFYIGRDDAKYRLTNVAFSWISLMLQAAGNRRLHELELSEDEIAEIRGDSTVWARLLYSHDREAFRRYLDEARQLDPDMAPSHPKYISKLSRYVGYEWAEAVAKVTRYPRTLARRLLQGVNPQWQVSVFDWT